MTLATYAIAACAVELQWM